MEFDIDVISQEVIPIGRIPGIGGRHVSMSTVYRWMDAGIAGIRLPNAWQGGKRITTREALAWWYAAVAAAKRSGLVSGQAGIVQATAMPSRRTLAQRERDDQRAARTLASKHGI